MSHIFISYSSKDRDRTAILAHALEQDGHAVWWDRELRGGQTFDTAIHKALTEAQVVMVLWSENSVQSDWVKDEAALGKTQGNLLPILIDDVAIPLGFGRIHAERLIDWDGDRQDPGYQELAEAIGAMQGAEPSKAKAPAPQHRPSNPVRKRSRWPYIAGLVLACLIIAVLLQQRVLQGFFVDTCEAPVRSARAGEVLYKIHVHTTPNPKAGTDSDIWLTIQGSNGTVGPEHLNPLVPMILSFEAGSSDCLSYYSGDVGVPQSITLKTEKDGLADFAPDWFPGDIAIQKDGVWYTAPIFEELRNGQERTYSLTPNDGYTG